MWHGRLAHVCYEEGNHGRAAHATKETMSKLREHLQKAKDSHQSARYPGDLAADVLMPAMSIGRQLKIGAAVAASIAAVVAIVVVIQHTAPPREPIAVNVSTKSTSTDSESSWLSFTIDRPTEMQYAFADIAASAATTTTSTTQATNANFSSSIPAIWGFPSVTSISEELSTSTSGETDQTQTDQEAS